MDAFQHEVGGGMLGGQQGWGGAGDGVPRCHGIPSHCKHAHEGSALHGWEGKEMGLSDW